MSYPLQERVGHVKRLQNELAHGHLAWVMVMVRIAWGGSGGTSTDYCEGVTLGGHPQGCRRLRCDVMGPDYRLPYYIVATGRTQRCFYRHPRSPCHPSPHTTVIIHSPKRRRKSAQHSSVCTRVRVMHIEPLYF